MRVLVIEDNKQMALRMKSGLKAHYAVDLAFTGKDGLFKAETTDYDLILLDLNLPDMNGLEICRVLRGKQVPVPILVLTGQGEIKAKVEALDLGVDDYLTKPFSLEEGLARMRALLRRTSYAGGTSTLAVDDLELDTAARAVRRSGKALRLRRKEFDLLEYLMRNEGRAVTRSMILEHVWDMNDGLWTNAVDVHIKHLRDKVDRPFPNQLIKTVYGIGYKLEAAKAAVVGKRGKGVSAP